jgi:Putative transposase DNA-binding domain
MMEQTEIINELIGIVDYLASIVERLAKQVPDDRDVPIARQVAIRAGRLRQETGLTQARFVCVGCGHAANADTNAAINILRRADGALKPVEGHRSGRPVEAGTSLEAA